MYMELGYTRHSVTVANEGLGWDPLLEMLLLLWGRLNSYDNQSPGAFESWTSLCLSFRPGTLSEFGTAVRSQPLSWLRS